MRFTPPSHRYALLASVLAASLATTFTPALAAFCDGISTASGTTIRTVRVASGLTKPCWVTSPPSDTHRIFILEQDGRVRIVKDGLLLPTSFLDVAAITRSPVDGGGNEQGLLGLAFSPTYATDGFFFIYHTDTAGTTNTVARYHVSANPDLADTSTRTPIITIPHPGNTNHNGGALIFGPDDGYLYLTTGDGGGSCDSPGNAQNTTSLLGKVVRIDVIPIPTPPNPPYRIPPDNPNFTAKEIYSIGLRNPWRYSFDGLTHDLYIGDVGQGVWEEIDFRPANDLGAAANYGWDHYEGFACPSPSCADPICGVILGRTDPIKVYDHSAGRCSITGGYVYRGCRIPALASQGRYYYSDFCAGNFESLVYTGGSVTSEVTVTTAITPSLDGFTVGAVTSFGEDVRGEIYIADRGGLGGTAGQGEIFKIVPPLTAFEVSGPSAPSLMLGTSWTWENVWVNTSYPIDSYRVYRHNGNGSGTFLCIFKTPGPVAPARGPVPSWPGGDPALPLPGAVFSYIVTAVFQRPGGLPLEETFAGAGTDGTPHVLSPVACP
jgi:glucose/arabinose dehydrogenase